MKFALLIYSRPGPGKPWSHPMFRVMEGVDREAGDRMAEEMAAVLRRADEAGMLVDSVALGDPKQARVVRTEPGGSEPIVTEGPFTEGKEFLAGFFIVEAPDVEAAAHLAAQWVDVRRPGQFIEVRPVDPGTTAQTLMDR